VIYFLCHPAPENYQWDIIPLAEGLLQLGIPFASSADYWLQPDESYLLPHDADIDPLDCELVIVSSGFLKWVKDGGGEEHGVLPEWLGRRGTRRCKVVALDVCDGYLTPATSRWNHGFDCVLRAHYNKRLQWPDNVRPWAFGLTDRILRASSEARLAWGDRDGCVFSFGASHGFPHGAREWAKREVLPELSNVLTIDSSEDDLRIPPSDSQEALLWKQCVRRHSSAYFSRMGASKACACFCGELVPGLPPRVSFLVGGNKARIKRIAWQLVSNSLRLLPRNVQPDSWRFWEALACETAVMHFDMEQSGWELPVMPENWKHYIGVDLDRPDKAIERLRDEPRLLENVAKQGRQWALENYSPLRAAQRLLEWCC
jgi:hypothetical protein